ncbi:PR domain zinc finger protein 4-like [Ptychodera flava]|uniref:PR domain zinc finger protein 4-like n=1 Tax=Ptychodera flava TaxID=63121 RepID=UPI00396AA0AF
MGRRSKKSLRAIRLSQIRWQKRRNATSAACGRGGDGEEAVAMETEPTPIEDGELSEIEEEEEEEEEEEVSVSASTKDDTIATRVRQKKRLNLDKVVEAMKKRKTSGDSNLLCPDQISHNGLNDEQLDNIGTFLNKQTSVIQQHMQQNDIDASERDQNNAENNQTDPLTSLQIYNEMKKLYGANLKYTLVRDTLISEMMTGSRALSSLPWQLLVGQSEACGGELGVFSKVYIKANTVFEPMAGPTFLPEDVTKEMNPRFLWPLFDDCKVSQYIDVSNEGSASWLRYMNPAPKLAMQNIEVRLVKNTIFFVTIRHIKPGSELLFWFSHPYCKLQYLPNDPEKATMRIECDKCQLQFSSPLYTHRHITAFHPYGLKTDKYTCYMCKEAVYGRKKLTNHMQDQHGTRAAWQCDLCGKAVHSRSYLKEHKRKVHLPEEKAKKYPCEQCGRMFKCRAHLRRHVECVHDRNFNLECEYCCKKFSSKKYLDKHLKAHKGEFPFVCDKCSKGFFDSHSLKVHLLTHSGVRPYKCSLCDTATSTKQLLQFHFKKSHGFTKENMPEIKRQMELTFDSSPVTGYKERDKPPRQRIFRTRPVDKSGTQETHDTAPSEESCRTDENITAADTLLQQKYNNGREILKEFLKVTVGTTSKQAVMY